MWTFRIAQCVLGFETGPWKMYNSFWLKLTLSHYTCIFHSVNWTKSWLVSRCWRAVITRVEEHPKYDWTEPACFAAVGMAQQQQQDLVIWTLICPLWVIKCHFALCCSYSRSLAVQVNAISDVKLDLDRDLLSHCPQKEGNWTPKSDF